MFTQLNGREKELPKKDEQNPEKNVTNEARTSFKQKKKSEHVFSVAVLLLYYSYFCGCFFFCFHVWVSDFINQKNI